MFISLRQFYLLRKTHRGRHREFSGVGLFLLHFFLVAYLLPGISSDNDATRKSIRHLSQLVRAVSSFRRRGGELAALFAPILRTFSIRHFVLPRRWNSHLLGQARPIPTLLGLVSPRPHSMFPSFLVSRVRFLTDELTD